MYFQLFNLKIPLYGLLCIIGLMSGTIYSINTLKKQKADIYDFIILECLTLLCAFIGSKAAFLITASSSIDWQRMLNDMTYFNAIMNGGFVFYGGAIAGAIGLIVIDKLMHLDMLKYLNLLIPALPLGHAFGRIGCFFAGCCYGIPYGGMLAYAYKNSVIAPNNIGLLPIQLIEAFFLFIMFFQLHHLASKSSLNTPYYYLIEYSGLRFILEYFRGDTIRGTIMGLSTSQFISLVIFIGTISVLIYKGVKKRI